MLGTAVVGILSWKRSRGYPEYVEYGAGWSLRMRGPYFKFRCQNARSRRQPRRPAEMVAVEPSAADRE